MTWYSERHFKQFPQLIKHLNSKAYQGKNTAWVYRGQLASYELRAMLERECTKSGINLSKAEKIEETIISQFRRIYSGDDRLDVGNDTLYCMSLLQHYGAPTRLLDFSYSKYVAVYFGLKAAYNSIETEEPVSFAVWCLETKDLNERAEKYCEGEKYREEKEGEEKNLVDAFEARYSYDERNDSSFKPLYMSNHNIVISENPVRIHHRLHLQQGVFLCPGNVKKSFTKNLKSMYTKKTTKVKKLVCTLDKFGVQEAFEVLMRMNITEESLFPGLDGVARSFNYTMWLSNKIRKK